MPSTGPQVLHSAELPCTSFGARLWVYPHSQTKAGQTHTSGESELLTQKIGMISLELLGPTRAHRAYLALNRIGVSAPPGQKAGVPWGGTLRS